MDFEDKEPVDKSPAPSPFEPDSKADDAAQNREQDYNPYQEYNYERAHGKVWYDEKGHQLPPPRPIPNNLAVASLFVSLASIALCCCNPLLSVAASIMAIALAVCSRFFNNPERRFYGRAVAAIVISSVVLVMVIGSILVTYALVPYLRENYPEFREYYDSIYRSLQQQLEQLPGEGTSSFNGI